MIRQGFGVPSETYQEAVSTQWMNTPSSQPAHNSAYVCNMPNVSNLPPQISSVYPGISLFNLPSIHSNPLTRPTSPTIAHCNAKHSNWLTATSSSAEDGANPTKSNINKDCRSTAEVAREVIRAPREPPPPSGKEEAKCPTGCFRQALASVENPQMTKPPVATHVPKAYVPILAVAVIPIQRHSNDPQLQMSRQLGHKKQEFSLPSNSQELFFQPTNAAFLSSNQQLVGSDDEGTSNLGPTSWTREKPWKTTLYVSTDQTEIFGIAFEFWMPQ